MVTVNRGSETSLCRRYLCCSAGTVLVMAMLAMHASAGIIVLEASGANPASITPTRDAFRAAVGGGTVPGANGDFGGLRREINWDGVPASFSDPNLLPNNFFNANSPRGVEFSTPGTAVMVSANAGGATPTLFGFPSDLQTFSPQKLFATIGSNILDIRFFVPGTTTQAVTSAFAAIFVDVEVSDATSMEFFDLQGSLIFSRNVLPAGNQGLSFLGGIADAGEQIARVRIRTSNFLISNGVLNNPNDDFVVMDDFLYASPTELIAPTAVPEPNTVGLLALGALILCVARRKASRCTSKL